MSQTYKPYFSKSIEDQIVNAVLAELYAEKQTADESAIRRYIQAPKSVYENTLLNGVAEGIYLATVKEDEFAYKINQASQVEVDEILESARIKADALKDLVAKPFVPPPLKVKNFDGNVAPQHKAHSEKMARKRHNKFVQRQKEKYESKTAAFDKSKQIPTAEQVREAINRDRNAKLSHALLWTKHSPKLNTKATSITLIEVKDEKDNAVAV